VNLVTKAAVEGEIASAQEVLDLIEKRKGEVSRGWTIIAVIVAINALMFFTVNYYAILWVLSSLMTCALVFILFLIPTTKRRVGQGKAPVLGEKGKMRKTVFMLLLWDMFFVNSQPLAAGMMIICALNFPFLFYSTLIDHSIPPEVMMMMLVQSVMIIGYYIGILYFRPYSSGFLEKMRLYGRQVKKTVRRDNLRQSLIVLAVIVAVTCFVLLVVIYTLLLPGVSLNVLKRSLSDLVLNVLFPDLIIFVSQVLLIRVLQGMESRKLVEDVLRNRIKTLNEDILPRWQELDTPTVQPDGRKKITTYKQKFLAMTIFRITSHDLFGYLPVYLLSPDFNAAKNREVAEEMEWLSGSDSLDVDVD
jgi:hypothetical protein